MPTAAARLSAPPDRVTALTEPLKAVSATTEQLEARVDRLADSALATRRAFVSLRSQAVTLSS